MTKATILSQCAEMFVIFCMASFASDSCLLKSFAEVAFSTFHGFMFAKKRKARQIVIKNCVFDP